MSFIDFLSTFWGAPSVQELSRQLAQRTYAPVRDSVEGRTAGMSRAEARGYVMAKASPIIRAELAVLVGRTPKLKGGLQRTVLHSASDRVVQSVLADINREKTRLTLRRAA